MQISAILRPEAVKPLSTVSSKKRLFHALADLAEDAHGLPAGATVEALLAREALGPTAVGHGVSLPHARLGGLERVVGCFIRLEKPIDLDAVDRQPVDLVFGLFAPQAAGVEHLKALAAVSRTLRDTGVCAKLRRNAQAATLHAILTEADAAQAA
ncbi:MAG: PTS sugar transporter subunit IIA [Shimia sp.]